MFCCGTVNLFPLSYAYKFEDIFQLLQKGNIFQFTNIQYVSKFKYMFRVFVFLLLGLKKYAYMMNKLYMPGTWPLPILWGQHDEYVYTYMHNEETYICHWIGIWKTQNIRRSFEIAANPVRATTMKTLSRISLENFTSNDNLLQHILRIYPGVDGTNIQLT